MVSIRSLSKIVIALGLSLVLMYTPAIDGLSIQNTGMVTCEAATKKIKSLPKGGYFVDNDNYFINPKIKNGRLNFSTWKLIEGKVYYKKSLYWFNSNGEECEGTFSLKLSSNCKIYVNYSNYCNETGRISKSDFNKGMKEGFCMMFHVNKKGKVDKICTGS